MMKPTIHLNGTGGDDLLEQLKEARLAAMALVDKLQAAWPNGRDYYPQGQDALKEASDEWGARIRKVQSVSDDMLAIAEHVMDNKRAS